MEYIYRKATWKDMELLVASRVEILRDANGLPQDTDMSQVERESRAYFQRALEDGSCICYLAFDGDRLAGVGGVSFYQVMPTYYTPTGQKAYIMNMYTSPDFRRKGIAYHILDLLIREIRNRGVVYIALEATDMGRPLYEKYGFVKMEHEMRLYPR